MKRAKPKRRRTIAAAERSIKRSLDGKFRRWVAGIRADAERCSVLLALISAKLEVGKPVPESTVTAIVERVTAHVRQLLRDMVAEELRGPRPGRNRRWQDLAAKVDAVAARLEEVATASGTK